MAVAVVTTVQRPRLLAAANKPNTPSWLFCQAGFLRTFEECDEQEVRNHRLGARDGNRSRRRVRVGRRNRFRLACCWDRLRRVIHGGGPKSFEIAITVHSPAPRMKGVTHGITRAGF